MRWLRSHFAPATWGPFAHGGICAEDLILHEVRRRLVAGGSGTLSEKLLAIYGSADRIQVRNSPSRQDFGVAGHLFVTYDISALTEAPTLVDVANLTINLANVFESSSAAGPVDEGYPTIASLLALERRILGNFDDGNRSLLEDVGVATAVPLAYNFRPGAQLSFPPVTTDKGAEVLVAVQQITYEVHIDHGTGKVSNVVENGG